MLKLLQPRAKGTFWCVCLSVCPLLSLFRSKFQEAVHGCGTSMLTDHVPLYMLGLILLTYKELNCIFNSILMLFLSFYSFGFDGVTFCWTKLNWLVLSGKSSSCSSSHHSPWTKTGLSPKTISPLMAQIFCLLRNWAQNHKNSNNLGARGLSWKAKETVWFTSVASES